MPFIYLALLFCCDTVFAINNTEKDTVSRVSRKLIIRLNERDSFFLSDTLLRLPYSLIPNTGTIKSRNVLFFDSLKAKSSKNIITRKLYDFLVIPPEKADNKRITRSSDASYVSYSGKKIRKIVIQRLSIFGSNINTTESVNPNKIENLLNKTHFYTNEKIIRKNLLFSEGDKISPLILSDNERILRQLSFINDARIIVLPVSENEADILVLTKDVYSLGASYSYNGLKKGSVSVFEKNILGTGQELGIDIPFESSEKNSPGFGVHYFADNMWKTFINMNLYYLNAIGEKTYGFDISRKLVSSTTKYAGGISVRQMSTTEDLDTIPIPQPLKYNLQDYWLLRSFLINEEKVSRIILGVRYMNNNVFDRPFILPDSHYNLQKYRIYLASAAFSFQKYYKANLIYGYGRTEDIPYGGLFRLTLGREYNEFNYNRKRTYVGTEISLGKSANKLGYFYASAGFATFVDGSPSKQGLLSLNMKYISNLISIGNYMIRNFLYADYTRGFDRNTDEILIVKRFNGFSGFRNDSIRGTQRVTLSLESVLFHPANLYGFRFAFFGFADLSYIFGQNQILGNVNPISSIGLGIRIRNDHLVFSTFQLRFGFFPGLPSYSKISNPILSGEQLLRPNNFDSGPPAVIPFR